MKRFPMPQDPVHERRRLSLFLLAFILMRP